METQYKLVKVYQKYFCPIELRLLMNYDEATVTNEIHINWENCCSNRGIGIYTGLKQFIEYFIPDRNVAKG